MANTPRRDEMYDHIVRELLQAKIDSPIDTLLRDAKVVTLRKLRQCLRKPGLEKYQWRDINNRDKMKDFSDDTKEDLSAIRSYLDWVQNHHGTIGYGHFNYLSKTRGNFDDYVGCHTSTH